MLPGRNQYDLLSLASQSEADFMFGQSFPTDACMSGHEGFRDLPQTRAAGSVALRRAIQKAV